MELTFAATELLKAKRETCTLANGTIHSKCNVGVDECSTIVIYKSFVFFPLAFLLCGACILFKTAAFVGEI